MTTIFYVSYVLLWLTVIFQSLILLGVVRTVYRRDADSSGTAETGRYLIGEIAPRFTPRDAAGAIIAGAPVAGQRSALLFVSPDCKSCVTTLEELEALKAKVNEHLLVICRGTADECNRLRQTQTLNGVSLAFDDDLKISALFDVHITPTAVLIDSNGRVESYGHPMHADELAELVGTIEALTNQGRKEEHLSVESA